MSVKIIVAVIIVLLIALGGIYLVLAPSETVVVTTAAAPTVAAAATVPLLSCGNHMKPVNGVCVPEVRYLSGFGYADCDQKYVWSKELNAYVDEQQNRALVVQDKTLTCYPVENGKIQSGNFGTRVLDVEVVFGEHSQNDVPEGTQRVLSGFRYANCDGHYRWSVEKKAFVNDERNRALTLEGPKLMCRDLKDGNLMGSFGTRVIGADGVSWDLP
jgi:hypothetical protein